MISAYGTREKSKLFVTEVFAPVNSVYMGFQRRLYKGGRT